MCWHRGPSAPTDRCPRVGAHQGAFTVSPPSGWHGDLDDTLAIADLLGHDPDDPVQEAVGSWIREAGERDPAPLRSFLDRHTATMPRTALRYAIDAASGTSDTTTMPVAWLLGGVTADGPAS